MHIHALLSGLFSATCANLRHYVVLTLLGHCKRKTPVTSRYTRVYGEVTGAIRMVASGNLPVHFCNAPVH